MKPTTALRKISALKKRIWGIQGGQGAGKTFSILLLLINHASNNENKEIYIASAELSKMRTTVIKDAVKIVNNLGLDVRMLGVDHGTPIFRFKNGSFIQFIGLDKADIGKGLRSDIMFVNEANKSNFDTYRELTSRAKRIIIDFNPNKKFWFHTEVQPREDCDFIKLTFQDNEFLSWQERSEILAYKQKGYKQDPQTGDYAVNDKGELIIINNYWANMWRVYGLGEVGQVEGRIYNWNKCSAADYFAMNVLEVFGNDWGKVDPWAVTGLKYYDGDLFVRQYHYKSENEIERSMMPEQLLAIKRGDVDGHEGLVSHQFAKLSIPYDAHIICDSNRPNKILSLRNSGWEYAQSVGRKMDLEQRISVLSGLNIFYTDDSPNIEFEQEEYCYDKDTKGVMLEKPVDQDNHAIDSIVYGTQWMFNEGIIKNI